MNTRIRILTNAAAAALCALSIGAPLAAGDLPVHHSRYNLVLLDTLGGPGSQINSGSGALNREGTVVGGADTPRWDDGCGCFVNHAVRWRDGLATDLGTLPDGDNFSTADSINSHGVIAGISNNGLIEPASGLPIFVAVLWKNGRIIDLGTLGGGFSLPNSINDRGDVVGAAQNTIEDPFRFGDLLGGLSSETQWHATLWKNGAARDLGTLGDGTGSFATVVNERGQATGIAFSDAVIHPETGFPAVSPFFWENGRMTNLGSLGGLSGYPTWMNNQGQVTGISDVTRDHAVQHAFLWDRGVLRDLGTFGGSFSSGNFIDDAGVVVGGSTTKDELRAFRWKNGRMTNLGSLHDGADPCSFANSSNARGQIVGQSISDCDVDSRAFLWENGEMVDLNSLIPPGSGLVLEEPQYINERGEIAGLARLPDGSSREFLLVPAGDRDGVVAEALAMESGQADARAYENATHGTLTPRKLAALQARLAKRHRFAGFTPSK